ncbi:methylenetetrahydrofolate reductase C-terminal domain-containing protein [Desulfatibacillum aliphaticivorans]|uniref:methylenetetrahydrofolate reductase C-terminal domain-containing protein n=1 Tax=Desulfatibacillum aliphaticivorans TaxID=218208 RepID=UPI0004093D78|nr:methylenetetrahydrofolate reductase C-terminal domain-containing protein [Desulfatibacillum aliphaticivorans]
MVKSEWKPEEEIRLALEGKDRIAVISCAVCANLSGTGGYQGLKKMRGLAKKWGKKVVLSQCVVACCSQEIMSQTKKMHLDPVASKCDALVMLSCSGGVKSAFIADPGMPIVAALDSMGSAVVTREESIIAESLCTGCGQCVLTYTGGICPLSKCPAKRQYSPCSKQPQEGDQCAVDPARKCVWKEIEKRGDLQALQALEARHKNSGEPRLASDIPPEFPGLGKTLAGWAMAKSGRFARIISSIL